MTPLENLSTEIFKILTVTPKLRRPNLYSIKLYSPGSQEKYSSYSSTWILSFCLENFRKGSLILQPSHATASNFHQFDMKLYTIISGAYTKQVLLTKINTNYKKIRL